MTELQILQCAYEDTVADLASQARRLLEFCELPWDDRVLEFHKNARAVQTPSRWQVRQPLYRSSLARWRHYAAELGPLWEASILDENRSATRHSPAPATAVSFQSNENHLYLD